MLQLFLGIAVAQAQPVHACIGDFIYRAGKDEVSVGARVRHGPDVAEISFSDYSRVGSTDLRWADGSLTIIDPVDKSNLVLVCSAEGATLVLPKSEYSPAKSIVLKRTTGSLWEVGKREGWLKPEN